MSLKSVITLICGFIFFIFNYDSYGQDGYSIVTQDLETWTRAGIKYKYNDNLTFRFDQQIRLNKNSSITDQVLTDLSMKYRFKNNLYLNAGLRYLLDKDNDQMFDHDFRFNFDAGYKHRVSRFSLNYRVRFQSRNEIGLSYLEGDELKNSLRFRAGIGYNFKNWKLDPAFSTEIFRSLDSGEGQFDKLRFTLGTSYNFKSYGKIGLFYRLEHELNVSYPKTTYIIGLNYTYTLKRKQ